jgi:hypothetical protein
VAAICRIGVGNLIMPNAGVMVLSEVYERLMMMFG